MPEGVAAAMAGAEGGGAYLVHAGKRYQVPRGGFGSSGVLSFLTVTRVGEAQSLMLCSISPALIDLGHVAALRNLAGIGYGCCHCGGESPVGMPMTTKYEIWGTLAYTANTWYHRRQIS